MIFRLKTRDLTETFGSPLGAQLVDLYVHVPGAVTTSTAAANASRNFTIAAPFAWSRLIQVQGFGQRYVDAGGATLGTVGITANPVSRFITVTVPKATLGTPGPGWGFTVVLTGQEGFTRRPGARLPADAAGVPVRRVRDGVRGPALHVRARLRAEADRRDHAARGDAVDRARLHARSRRAVGRLDPVERPPCGSQPDAGSRPSEPGRTIALMESDSPGPANVVHCNVEHGLHLERDKVKALLAAGDFFWLDIHEPKKADLEILREEFHFHPLSLEDSWQFDQRPKIDDYDGYVFLVVFGASGQADADGLVEVHCFYSDRFLITLHRDDAPSLAALRERYVKRDYAGRRPGAAAAQGRRRPRRQLLPAPRRDRRPDRRARGLDLRQRRRRAAAGDLLDEALARRACGR